MSAKPTEEQPEKKVDEVAKQLAEATVSNGAEEDDSASAKKREKKARQKAKKDAMKGDETPTKPKEDKPEDAAAPSGAKAGGGNKKKNKAKGTSGVGGAKTQTDPPTLPVSQLFPGGNFPEGQIMEHPIGNDDSKAKQRFSSEEARALDRAQLDMYNEIRYDDIVGIKCT